MGVSVRPFLLDSGFHRSDEWREASPSFRRTPESSDLEDGIECPYNNGLINTNALNKVTSPSPAPSPLKWGGGRG
jgi:hypothetical protein